MASMKNSYDAPLLSADTEFELLSESTKHANPYDNTPTSHRQPQFNPEPTEPSRRSNRSSTSAIYYNGPKDSNQFGMTMEQNLIKNGIDINHHRQNASNSSRTSIEIQHDPYRNSIYNPTHVQSNNVSGTLTYTAQSAPFLPHSLHANSH